MDIGEYADAINVDLIVTRYANRGAGLDMHVPNWCAVLEHMERKGEGVLEGICGNGDTPGEAIQDLVSQIRGHVIVFDAYSTDNRIEYRVPKSLRA